MPTRVYPESNTSRLFSAPVRPFRAVHASLRRNALCWRPQHYRCPAGGSFGCQLPCWHFRIFPQMRRVPRLPDSRRRLLPTAVRNRRGLACSFSGPSRYQFLARLTWHISLCVMPCHFGVPVLCATRICSFLKPWWVERLSEARGGINRLPLRFPV